MNVKDIELKNDGHDFDRFKELARKVVNVPKEEIKRREAEYKKAAKIAPPKATILTAA